MTEQYTHKIPERLRQREAERKALLEKKKQVKDASAEDSIKRFSLDFAKRKLDIESQLSNSSNVKQEELQLFFDEVNVAIQQLQKLVTDSTMFLTSYDLRTSQHHVNHLQTMLAEKQDQLMPKKKFTFTKRTKEKETSSYDVVSDKDKNAGQLISTAILTNPLQHGIFSKRDEICVMKESEINAQDIVVNELTGCEVKLFGSPSTLHITNCVDCKIFSGPVCSSVFVDNCKSCIFVVACQQLRTHQTEHSSFYLHVTSKGIIEDCTEIKVAPYNWKYPELLVHYQVSGLDTTTNNWNKIDDFNWLSVNEPSPHWKVMNESERIIDWKES
ncbi:tubulin-specific chaperone C-like isoform X2 [Dysidea avara]|uniref:tubulin-specific chaperone C-like isoform X2 n=1 Tax=Dysidea avara TaxID=196820 RepID=UPI00331D80D4